MSSEDNGADRVPYLPYTTFRSGLQKLRVNGQLPTRIDRSVLTNMPGGTQGHFLVALRTLKLIDGDDSPTSALERLTADDGGYGPALRELLEKCYSNNVLEQLARGTPKALVDSMPPKSRGTQTKAALFLVKAAQEADITVSPHMVDSKGKPKGFGRRAKPKPRKTASAANSVEPAPAEVTSTDTQTADQKFLLGGGRQAELRWPEDITKSEIEKMYDQLTAFQKFLEVQAGVRAMANADEPEEEDNGYEE